MTSELQARANARNAERSTGPRTAQGKARVAHNAWRHGLRAAQGALEPEEEAAYQANVAALAEHFQPADALEEALVASIADLLWRKQRARDYEASLLRAHREAAAEAARQAEGETRVPLDPLLPTPAPAAPGMRAFERELAFCGVALPGVARYESQLDRALHRALLRLDAEREHRRPGSMPRGGAYYARGAGLDRTLDAITGEGPTYAPPAPSGVTWEDVRDLNGFLGEE